MFEINIFEKCNSKSYSGLTELLVSVKLLKSLLGCWAALRPRFPLPLGVRESSSSVGESQNLKKKKKYYILNTRKFVINYIYLGGAHSCLVQSINVPT